MVAIAHSFYSDDSEHYLDETYITKSLAIRARLPKIKEPLAPATEPRLNVLKQHLINQTETTNTVKNPLSESLYPSKRNTTTTKSTNKASKPKMPWQGIANDPDHPVNTRRRLAFFQTFAELAN